MSDGKECRPRDAIGNFADQFEFTEAARKETLPSGKGIFVDRVAGTKLSEKSRSPSSPMRPCLQITERGQTVLSQKPKMIDAKFLRQFPEFNESHTAQKLGGEGSIAEVPDQSGQTPEELLDSCYWRLRKQLEFDLSARVKSYPLDFFERLARSTPHYYGVRRFAE